MPDYTKPHRILFKNVKKNALLREPEQHYGEFAFWIPASILGKQGGYYTSWVVPQKDDGLIEHEFLLRKDLKIKFRIPADVTTQEIERFKNFASTLVF